MYRVYSRNTSDLGEEVSDSVRRFILTHGSIRQKHAKQRCNKLSKVRQSMHERDNLVASLRILAVHEDVGV